MVDQATINNGHSPASGMGRNMAGFAADVTELVELQARLFQADSLRMASACKLPAFCLLAGTVMTLGCMPIALATLALTLVSLTTLSLALAFLVSLGVGLTLAAGLLLVGWLLLRDGFANFDRSCVELSRNVAWLKQTLRRSGNRSFE